MKGALGTYSSPELVQRSLEMHLHQQQLCVVPVHKQFLTLQLHNQQNFIADCQAKQVKSTAYESHVELVDEQLLNKHN